MTMECDEGKGLSEKLEVNSRETMHATPRIKVRKDIGGIDVVQTINLMHRLEELEGTDAEEEVQIINVVKGDTKGVEGEMEGVEGDVKGGLEKRVFGELLPKLGKGSKKKTVKKRSG